MDRVDMFVKLVNEVVEYEKSNSKSFHTCVQNSKMKVDFVDYAIMEDKIAGYFINIFKNISTNSVLIVQGEDAIAIGNYGIGIRENKQARPVKHFYQLKTLHSKKEDIIKGLNNVRKWKRSEDFKLFMDIYEEYLNLKKVYEFTLPENTNVLYCDTWNNLVISKHSTPLLNFNTQNGEIYCIDKQENRTIIIGNRVGNYDMSGIAQILNFMEVGKHKDIIEVNIHNILSEVTKNNKEILAKLDKNFGRYFMVNEL